MLFIYFFLIINLLALSKEIVKHVSNSMFYGLGCIAYVAILGDIFLN